MHFKAKESTVHEKNIYIDNIVLNWVNESNYLGYTLDSTFKQNKREVERRLMSMRVMVM